MINFKLNSKILLIFNFIFIYLFTPNISFSEDKFYNKINHANILMYHRFGENKYPTTNTTIEQFISHTNELVKDKYDVIRLDKVIEGLKDKINLKDRSVSITIDDAYLSVYTKAWPILKKLNLPFTLFISTDVIDNNFSNYMNWNQIRELVDNGVLVGSQTKSHPHLHRLSSKQILNEIEYSNKRFIKELGFKPKLFAYPYGEYDNKTIEIVKGSGFEAAFGQHSGVAHISSGIFELPRFAMNKNYGDLTRLKLATNALPIIIKDISPEDNFIKVNPPDFGFTLSSKIKPMRAVRCFASNGIVTNTKRIGKFRIEVRLEEKFPNARGRINCTMAAKDGRWRWFGKQFVTK